MLKASLLGNVVRFHVENFSRAAVLAGLVLSAPLCTTQVLAEEWPQRVVSH